jgi:hypothetical protein
MTVFWDVAPCSLVQIYGCFRGIKHFWNVAQFLRFYTTQHPWRHLHSRLRENLKSHSILWRWLPSGMLRRVALYKLTDVSEALITSETSVSSYDTTRHNIPEDIFILVSVRTWYLTTYFEDGGDKFLRNFGKCVGYKTTRRHNPEDRSQYTCHTRFSCIRKCSNLPWLSANAGTYTTIGI